MGKFQRMLVIGGLCAVALSACADKKKTGEPIPDTWALTGQECLSGKSTSVLAGRWRVFRQGRAIPLVLDEQGNSPHSMKEGQLLTSCLDKLIWRGRWIYSGNVPEGSFEIRLNPSLDKGEGRWLTVLPELGRQTELIRMERMVDSPGQASLPPEPMPQEALVQ